MRSPVLENVEIVPGCSDEVKQFAVFGCGPVGQFAIASAKLMGAGRIFAVDRVESRLDTARIQGAEAIDFEADDPVDALKELTGGIGPDCAIDAVGVDATTAHHGPASRGHREERNKMTEELKEIAPDAAPKGGWGPSIRQRFPVSASLWRRPWTRIARSTSVSQGG